jgi:hypothetical protein
VPRRAATIHLSSSWRRKEEGIGFKISSLPRPPEPSPYILQCFNQSFLLTTEQHEISSNKIMLPLSVSINGFDQYILPQYYSNILVITMGDSANQAKTKCSHLLQKEGFRFISKILE